jgi:hypothetical protein
MCRNVSTFVSKVNASESPVFTYTGNFSATAPGPACDSDAVPAFMTWGAGAAPLQRQRKHA